MIRSTMRLSVALLVVLAALPLAAQTKVAVIDVQRVVTESDPGKEALGELKGLQDQKLEQGRVIQQELDALREQYTKQRNLLDPEKAEQLNKQIEDKAIALRRFHRTGAGSDVDLQQVPVGPGLRRRVRGHHGRCHPTLQHHPVTSGGVG